MTILAETWSELSEHGYRHAGEARVFPSTAEHVVPKDDRESLRRGASVGYTYGPVKPDIAKVASA